MNSPKTAEGSANQMSDTGTYTTSARPVVVDLANDFSQRPTEAHLHALRQGDETQVWLTGVSLCNYESIVGPSRAQRHRMSFLAGRPASHRFGRRLMGRLRLRA